MVRSFFFFQIALLWGGLWVSKENGSPYLQVGKAGSPQYVCKGVTNSTLISYLLIQGSCPRCWSVILHRLPGQCHLLLTAPEADSWRPRARVLSLRQYASVGCFSLPPSALWEAALAVCETWHSPSASKSHPGQCVFKWDPTALSASAHWPQDGHLLKWVK